MNEPRSAVAMANKPFMRSVTEAAPLIVRVAGLPAAAVAPFASDLGSRVARLRSLEADLVHAREQLVEQLHTAVHDGPAKDRRLLLAIKRDSFNGRSLQKYREQASSISVQIAGLKAVLHLEDQQVAWEEDFQAAYAAQFERERSWLTQFLEDRRFLRGVAVSSSLLVEHLPRLEAKDKQESGRRDKRLLISLLRYVSRAALKLSPFASLTGVGIGLVAPLNSASEFQLARPDSWSERSHVSLHRSLLERLAHVLLHYRPFRDGLLISLNQTLDSPSPGKFAFIRPPFWEEAQESPYLKIIMSSRVKVDLKGPVIEWLLGNLKLAKRTYSELLVVLQAVLPDTSSEEQRVTIDRLLQIGFLCFVWPWEASDPAPEARLLEFLETVADDMGVATLLPPLRATVSMIAEFPQSPSPGAAIKQGKEQMRTTLKAAAELGGLDSRIGTAETREWFFHEDIFIGSELPSRALALLSPSQAWELLQQLGPLARLSELFSLRHDFLLTMAAFAAHHWPDRSTIGFLDFFEGTYPLFQEFIRFDKASRRGGPLRAHAFNPLGLATLHDLLAYRVEALKALACCIEDGGAEYQLQHGSLQRFLDSLPPSHTRERDFCAFLQPVDGRGTRWALNNLLEGAGRMGSRYTTVMDPIARERFTSSFRARSRYAGTWHEGELCDLLWPGGQAVNVHAYQTERILSMPGQTLAIAPERLISPSSLRVHLQGPDRPPYLADDHDHILPVHLGALAFRYLPSLAKFLTFFGPGEIRFCAPQREPQLCGGVEISQRHILGNVVYRRKNWSFAVEDLRSRVSGTSPSKAFSVINHWRAEHDIPEHVYLAEPIPGSGASPHLKPQYIDFTSCLFVELFRSVLERNQERLKLFEALPDPDQLMPTKDGSRLAVEIQLDSFGFVHPERNGKPQFLRNDSQLSETQNALSLEPIPTQPPYTDPALAENTHRHGAKTPNTGH
jgi:hypothetical protein